MQLWLHFIVQASEQSERARTPHIQGVPKKVFVFSNANNFFVRSAIKMVSTAF